MRPTNKTSYNSLLLLLIPTFILIVAWIGFNVYGSRVQSTVNETQTKQIKPNSPTFDLATIETLKTREKISPILTLEVPIVEEIASESGETLIPLPSPSPADQSSAESSSASAVPAENGGLQ